MTIALILALALSIILVLVHTWDKFTELKDVSSDLREGDYDGDEEKKDLERWLTENAVKVAAGLGISIFDLVMVILLI